MNKVLVIIVFLIFTLFTSNCFGYTKIEIQFIDGFSKEDQIKANQSISLLEELINSDAFKAKIIAHKKFRRNKIIGSNQRFSNQEILTQLLEGKALNSEKDQVIQLKVKLYDDDKNEIGHTDSNWVIHTSRKHFDKNDPSCYASHLLHEYCHVMGYRHAYLPLPGRNSTVPYAIGNIAQRMFKSACS